MVEIEVWMVQYLALAYGMKVNDYDDSIHHCCDEMEDVELGWGCSILTKWADTHQRARQPACFPRPCSCSDKQSSFLDAAEPT